jgi:hypothetical protein
MSVRLKVLLAIAIMLTAGGLPICAEAPAAAEDRLDRLELLTRSFYLAAVEGNRQLAYASLLRIEDAAESPELRAIGEPAGWSRIDATIAAARKALVRERDVSAWREEASRLLLAVDALAPGRESLWLGYGRLIGDDLDRMRRGWQRGGREGAEAAAVSLRLMKERVERLEAAAALNRPLPAVMRLGERIRYAEKLLGAAAETGEANRVWIEESFDAIGRAAEELFGPEAVRSSARPADDPSPAWIAALSAILCAALGYAGYRKYRQDRWGITSVRRPH